MARTTKARPFASNLEYLAATLDYLQTLARKRIASRQLEAARSGMKASRYEQAERQELLGSAANSSVGLQHLQRRLDTDLRHKHDALERRTQITLAAGAPVATGIDFASLAQDYDFAGGTIRNVLLRAVFEAATDGQVITAAILRRCAAAETPLRPLRQIGFEQGAA